MTTTELRTDQRSADTHVMRVGAAQTPEPASAYATPMCPPPVRVPNSATDQHAYDAHPRLVGGGPASPATKGSSTPSRDASPGISSSDNGHWCSDAQRAYAVVASTPPAPAVNGSAPMVHPPVLVDQELAVLANRVNDLENFRKANANQLEVLTRDRVDKDGEVRGFALPAGAPAVVQSQAIVDAIKKVEDQTVRELEKKLRKTPLGPWILSQKGLGAKTIARLLAATGDPYWNDLHNRPRTVSELWAFCGYRPGQRKTKGERVNWSPEAKMRAFNCIDPVKQQLRKPCVSLRDEDGNHIGAEHVDGCQCSPYRVIYDQAKAQYVGTLHPEECHRCTGKGKPPAEIGSPRKPAHVDQMAIRYTTKVMLRNLWREAKRLHELPGGHGRGDTQTFAAAGDPYSFVGQVKPDTQAVRADGGG
jgi:hypothetical protein